MGPENGRPARVIERNELVDDPVVLRMQPMDIELRWCGSQDYAARTDQIALDL